MSGSSRQLTDRIRNEAENLDRAVERAEQAWRRFQQSSDDYYLDSVALNLHGFYAGLERIFELIAASLDEASLEGERWHQELLQQMARDVPGVRPPVISISSRDGLDAYRAFRHVVRNVYAFRFDPIRIASLVTNIHPVYIRVRAELLGFADFLDARA